MNTFDYRETNHSILNDNVIACDTQWLRVRETTSPVYHSVAMRAASGEVLGWDISIQSAPYRSLLRAIQASLTTWGGYGGRPGPCYCVDAAMDSQRLAQALKDSGTDVSFCNPASHGQSVTLERFFRDFNRFVLDELGGDNGELAEVMYPTLARQRKWFQHWLKSYQQGSHSGQSAAEGFPSKAPPPFPRQRSKNRE